MFNRGCCIRIGAALLGLALTSSAGAVDELGTRGSARPLTPPTASQERLHMWITVGTQRFAVTLEDNSTARAFVHLLPATFVMTELNGNEKYARLPRSLPTKAVQPGTIRAGDILLYGNDTVVVFYETFQTSYSYTPIGRVVDGDGLAMALGPGNPRVVFTAP
jgi:hypothetical protein